MKRPRTVVLLSINPALRVIGVMPTCILGSAYSATVHAFGGSGSGYIFTPDPAQTLPAGLAATNPGDGTYTISGTTSVPGPVHIYGTLTDSARTPPVPYSFTFLVQPLPLALTGHINAGITGAAATGGYTGSGGIAPYTYSLIGVAPAAINASTGAATGTLGAPAAYSWIARVTDNVGTTADLADSANVTYPTLTLTGAFGNIYDNGDAGSTAGSMAIAGGQTPYSISGSGLASGTLPTGLSLSVSGSTLVLTGTTTAYGSFTFVPQVHSADGQTANGPSQTIIVGDPLWSHVAFAIHFDGFTTNIVDQKGGTWNCIHSAIQSSAWFRFGGESLRTQSINGDCVQSSSTSAYEVGSSDFSFDGWINAVSLPTTSGTFAFPASKDNGNSTQLLAIQGSTGKLYAGLIDGSSNFYGVFALASTATGTAIHFETTRHGNTLYLFLNGVLQGTAALPPGMTVFATSNKFTFGSQGPATVSFFDGYLDDVRLTIGASRHTANFTPPTRAFPNGGV